MREAARRGTVDEGKAQIAREDGATRSSLTEQIRSGSDAHDRWKGVHVCTTPSQTSSIRA